jgi:hypothetical protein
VLEEARARGRLGAIAAPRVAVRDVYAGWYDVDEKLRAGVALGDKKLVAQALQQLVWHHQQPGDASALLTALTVHAPASWIAQLPPNRVIELLAEGLHFATSYLVAPGDDFLAAASQSADAEVRGLAAVALALRGKGEEARAIVPAESKGPWELGARAVAEFTLGRWAEALATFDRANATKQGGRRVRGLPSILGVLDLLLAASPAGRAADLPGLPARIDASQTRDEWPWAAEALSALAAFRATGRPQPLTPLYRGPDSQWIERLVHALAARWTGQDGASQKRLLAPLRQRAEAMGYAWVAEQLKSLTEDDATEGTLAALSSTAAPWEIALEALAGTVAAQAPAATNADGPRGVAWVVEIVRGDEDIDLDGEPMEARITARLMKKNGQLGGKVGLERLDTDASLPLTPEDRALAASVVAARRSRYSPTVPLRTLLLAVGHPRVHDADGAITVERGEPEIRVEETPQGARLTMFPRNWDRAGVFAWQEPGRIVL